MYFLDYTNECKAAIKKAIRKNSELEKALESQITKLLENPRQGKPLRAPFMGKWRVHVLSSFVLIYEFSEKTKTLLLLKFKHHDEAYQI